jgi:hypothetical protein
VVRSIADLALRHAVAIVLADCALAIAAFWTGWIPAFLIHPIAGATALAALFVLVFHGLPREFRSKEQLGFRRNRDLLVYQFFNRGFSDNVYGLGAAWFIAAFLSGFRPPQISLIFAAGFLIGAWSMAMRRYPSDDGGSGRT